MASDTVREIDKAAPVYNERGVIAESYRELQGLDALAAARRASPLPKASGESTLRAVMQAVEIALLNLADVVARAADDVSSGRVGAASVKMSWARGFHRVLSRLSLLPQQLGFPAEPARFGVLRISESPAFREYVETLSRFDRSVKTAIEGGLLRIEAAVADGSLDDSEFMLLHLARLCNHESTAWERNLACVTVPATVRSYEDFVVSQGMRDAVYERVLTGDTYFTQFRGLHQVPEILGEELNDRVEQAIREIRYKRLGDAVDHLTCANLLSEGVLASLPPMADNLATSDYHRIRENLGLTSGSHSVCLRFHMFTHLYEQLWEEYRLFITSIAPDAAEPAEKAVCAVDRRRGEDATAWLAHIVGNECLKLRAFIFQWRDLHLNLPRNNLGGEFTKSLTGSPDAVQAVRQMRDTAIARDPMLPLARARGLSTHQRDEPAGALSEYLDSDASLDSLILSTTGQITQRRFHDVQERLGFFANRCPFVVPPRRTVLDPS